MDDMARIDDRTVDRLLSGGLTADDAPPGLGNVAEIVRSALVPGKPTELARETSVVSMAAAVSSEAMSSYAPAPGGARTPRRRMLGKVLTGKAIAAATIAALGLGTAAAAATGSLPGQASHGSATNVLTQGSTNNNSGGNHNSSSQNGANSKAPIVIAGVSFAATGPANGHAIPGLCTALEAQFAQNPKSPSFTHAKPFETLISKTGGTPTAADSWCKANTSNSGLNADTQNNEPPTTESANSHTSTPPVSTPNNHDKSSTNSHAPTSTPPVSTPNSGGTGTADTASGGSSGTGTSTAGIASGGHSTDGSGNASGQ